MSVPKLRFPEFRNVEEWEEKSFYDLLLDVLDFRGRTPKKLGMDWGGGNIVSLSANNVKNGYIDFNAECNLGSEELYEKWMGGVKLEKGDIVFTMEAPLGNALLIPDSQRYILSQRVVVFKTKKEEVDNNFLIQLIWSDVFQNAIHLLSTGSTAKGINQKNLKAVNIEIPNLLEQKKIADCLSSISDRITLEIQKLDTLKAHKKGLIQQLFPAEGETLPKLRFPEFHDSGDWEEEDLSKLTSCGLSNGVFNDPKKVGRGYKLINVLDMYIDTAINEDNLSLVELSRDEFLKNKVENGDLFFTRSSLVKSGIAYSNIYLENSDNITFDGHLIRFRPNKNILMPIFVNYLLRTNKVRSQLVARGKTATMTTIGQTDVGSVKLSFPHITEQKKIADCLCSIDEAITAQSQAIDLLKLHKKGLMQQLFPMVEEVKG